MNKKEVWNSLYKKNLIWKKETVFLPNLFRGKSILELGVGTGKTLISILNKNPKKVDAIDFSEEAIEKLGKNMVFKNLNFFQKDFLDFKTKEKYDIVFCYYFLNNFNEKEREIVSSKILGLLKKDGKLLFEDFMKGDYRQKGEKIENNTIRKKSGIVCHFFTKKELSKLFKKSKINFKTRITSPIKSDKKIKRKIISALIAKNARDRS